eukprot:CAMPEP_0206567000 /NCGR_PEP_ID=MMETSP0325_2-20121206/24990_1 /ASSEMBLY_ACC=CAM_ASM_000347 /TAXON_ID=2866 /ORGANISM="Crypthecodinium cohnii, Strain Seligo" /LENGTH=403 /DNA_ID=CAMNT_0054070131 /DNA_START=201 /DNA_END=1413 /DNA_ORIENTATION=+
MAPSLGSFDGSEGDSIGLLTNPEASSSAGATPPARRGGSILSRRRLDTGLPLSRPDSSDLKEALTLDGFRLVPPFDPQIEHYASEVCFRDDGQDIEVRALGVDHLSEIRFEGGGLSSSGTGAAAGFLTLQGNDDWHRATSSRDPGRCANLGILVSSIDGKYVKRYEINLQEHCRTTRLVDFWISGEGHTPSTGSKNKNHPVLAAHDPPCELDPPFDSRQHSYRCVLRDVVDNATVELWPSMENPGVNCPGCAIYFPDGEDEHLRSRYLWRGDEAWQLHLLAGEVRNVTVIASNTTMLSASYHIEFTAEALTTTTTASPVEFLQSHSSIFLLVGGSLLLLVLAIVGALLLRAFSKSEYTAVKPSDSRPSRSALGDPLRENTNSGGTSERNSRRAIQVVPGQNGA